MGKWLGSVRAPTSLAAMFVVAAFAYAIGFWGLTNLGANSAWSRFDALASSGAYGRAVGHGDHALALRTRAGEDGQAVQLMQLQLAEAHRLGGVPERAITLFESVLNSPLGSQMTDVEQADLRNKVAQLNLSVGDPIRAAVLVAGFVDASGDAASRHHTEDHSSYEMTLLQYVDAALDGFTDALPPVAEHELIEGEESQRLQTAGHLTNLGGYYARSRKGDYAAAGLLATAYRTRMNILGADDADTVHTALLLAPVYERIDRITDAEKVYLSAFHAQERAKGPNNPE
ncbi:MAG: hypothetical protein AAF986_07810, partial [Pseudomonadota bacterium]